MTHETEKEIIEFMGRIDERTKNLVERFDRLPCGSQSKRLDKLEQWQDQTIGKISIISAIFGIVGYLVSLAVGFLIKHN